MQVCLKGHKITSSYQRFPDSRKDFCPKCGERTITQCPSCNAAIPGHLFMAGVVSFTDEEPTDYCPACGKPYPWCDTKLATANAPKTGSNMSRKPSRKKLVPTVPVVFIGHGRSLLWKELKDFLVERLHLGYVEFNSESAAGFATKERLEQLLEEASFAFLVMTAEDEHADGTTHARENVVHEAGLFQGRLGFQKAIILREDGCIEFSNVVGLTHIPFPKGNIKAAFEEMRRVLEREGILGADGTVNSIRALRPAPRKTKPASTGPKGKVTADLVVRTPDGVRYGTQRPKEFNTPATCTFRVSFDIFNESGRILSIRRACAFLDNDKRPLAVGGANTVADLQPRGGRVTYNLETQLVDDPGQLPALASLSFEVVQEDRPRLYVPGSDGRQMIRSEVARDAGIKRMAKRVPGSGKLFARVTLLRPAPGDAEAWLVLDESGTTQTVSCSMLLGLANEPLGTT